MTYDKAYDQISDNIENVPEDFQRILNHRLLSREEIRDYISDFNSYKKKAIGILANFPKAREFAYDIATKKSHTSLTEYGTFGHYFLSGHMLTRDWALNHKAEDINARVLNSWMPQARFVFEANELTKKKANVPLEKMLYARDEIVAHNLKLSYYIARKIITGSPWQRKGDIGNPKTYLSAGILGLQRAIETYDDNMGTFGTYASWWIRREILIDVNKNNPLRLSQGSLQRLGKINKITREFLAEKGRQPYASEI